jgi:hypothetical protein
MVGSSLAGSRERNRARAGATAGLDQLLLTVGFLAISDVADAGCTSGWRFNHSARRCAGVLFA